MILTHGNTHSLDGHILYILCERDLFYSPRKDSLKPLLTSVGLIPFYLTCTYGIGSTISVKDVPILSLTVKLMEIHTFDINLVI